MENIIETRNAGDAQVEPAALAVEQPTIPTEEVPVKDVSGAGDTFLAGLVCKYIKTNDIEKSIKFAQECTMKVVQKHGVTTI